MSLRFFPTSNGGVNSSQIFYIQRLPSSWRLIRPGNTNTSRYKDLISEEQIAHLSSALPEGWLEILDLDEKHIFLNLNMVGWYASQEEPDDRWRHSFSPIIVTGSWALLVPEVSVVLKESSLVEAIASSHLPNGERIRFGFPDAVPVLSSETTTSEEVDHVTAQAGSPRRNFWKKNN